MKRLVVLLAIVFLSMSVGFLFGARADVLIRSFSAILDRDGFNEIPVEYFDVDIMSLITIQTPEDVETKRAQLLDYIWQGRNGQHSRPNAVIYDHVDERYSELKNLERIDRIEVTMDYGLNSVAYHFLPVNQSSNELIIYHQGHRGDFVLGKETIQFFVAEGYPVLAFAMPLLGMNNQPIVYLERFGPLKLQVHDHLKFLDAPVRFFVEPITAALNHLDENHDYKSVHMVGVSGGGWTTTLYAAIDPRITKSYPVAGSYPIYLRSNSLKDWGDYEQTLPDLLGIANYLELYVLGSYGQGRRQLQIINQYDPVCFGGVKYRTYEGYVSSLVDELGAGRFAVFLDDTHREHKISKRALDVIINDLQD